MEIFNQCLAQFIKYNTESKTTETEFFFPLKHDLRKSARDAFH